MNPLATFLRQQPIDRLAMLLHTLSAAMGISFN
jgi:hypothetical protein